MVGNASLLKEHDSYMKLHKPTSDESSLIVSKPKVTSLFCIKQKKKLP